MHSTGKKNSSTESALPMDQVQKLEGNGKKQSTDLQERSEEPDASNAGNAHDDQNANHEQEIAVTVQTETQEVHESSHNFRDLNAIPNQMMGDESLTHFDL
ncbi:uncharacterized protein A4U43_C07F12860 [Asparagus officinalis]|uniref:Uncharacterized protein n=1 Tax=Asparagus officinalis TaxID=4686 RepID=A0A5P1EBU2_ASPOF|nr:uncharacterized protein A4U43_C07F12860 [Asparagus officinalis]